jgi:hypothetical protein
VDSLPGPWLSVLAGLGVAGGLFLLARGLGGYRTQLRVADIATSTIGTIAAGEVRVSGVVEPAELTLVSLLQSRACVYYRSKVGDAGDEDRLVRGYREERSVGFRIHDGTGSLRIFPRGGRFDAPLRFEGETGTMGDEPAGLDIRQGGPTRAGEADRAVAAAELLRVRTPWDWSPLAGIGGRDGRRTYREWRIEPGDEITVVGRAVPFGDLPDPAGADLGNAIAAEADDPEIAADLAEARAAGILADHAADAWGNAAIPGFGIGRPATNPALDPGADRLALASADEVARTERTFEIAPETLVVTASDEVPLLIAYGSPGAVVRRGSSRLLVGLLGAVVAIASAMVLAISVSGGFTT